jgi:hypothetical protein
MGRSCCGSSLLRVVTIRGLSTATPIGRQCCHHQTAQRLGATGQVDLVSSIFVNLSNKGFVASQADNDHLKTSRRSYFGKLVYAGDKSD